MQFNKMSKAQLIELAISKGIIKVQLVESTIAVFDKLFKKKETELERKIQSLSNRFSKTELVDMLNANVKKTKLAIRHTKAGVSDIFGTKRNTHAHRVCQLIAESKVHSKSDIRNTYVYNGIAYGKKYSFNETLNRLQIEGIIRFNDTKQSTFTLTEKGKNLASIELAKTG